MFYRKHFIVLAIVVGGIFVCSGQGDHARIQGWNILPVSYEDALATIGAAKQYNINHRLGGI